MLFFVWMRAIVFHPLREEKRRQSLFFDLQYRASYKTGLRLSLPATESTCKDFMPHKCWSPKSLSSMHHLKNNALNDPIVEI